MRHSRSARSPAKNTEPLIAGQPACPTDYVLWPGVLLVQLAARPRLHESDGGAADAAGLELPALPTCDRDEEQRELLELPHLLPLRGVVAPWAGPGLSGAKVLLLGAEAEKDEHHVSVGGDARELVLRQRDPRPGVVALRPRRPVNTWLCHRAGAPLLTGSAPGLLALDQAGRLRRARRLRDRRACQCVRPTSRRARCTAVGRSLPVRARVSWAAS